MLKIKEVNNKKVWDNFVIKQKLYTFFHSYLWGEFNKNLGNQIFRFGIYEKEKLVGVVLIILVHAKRGNFLFCPHGPIFKEEKAVYWNKFLSFLKDLGKEKGVTFVRVSPASAKSERLAAIFKKAKFINAPIHMSAESFWVLPLYDKSLEQILKGMRKTTRYEIRKAEKLNFKVIKSQDVKDIKIFLRFYKKTADRENFVPFSDKYLTYEFSTFAKDNCALLFLEKHGQEYVAGLMVIYYGKGAFYHQGATLHLSHESVSYLAQWEAIKEAKARGCQFYNFWGIAPNNDPKHPWYGLSLFKRGFGGERVDFIHAQDFPLNYWKYIPTYLFETLRKVTRRV